MFTHRTDSEVASIADVDVHYNYKCASVCLFASLIRRITSYSVFFVTLFRCRCCWLLYFYRLLSLADDCADLFLFLQQSLEPLQIQSGGWRVYQNRGGFSALLIQLRIIFWKEEWVINPIEFEKSNWDGYNQVSISKCRQINLNTIVSIKALPVVIKLHMHTVKTA